MNNAERAKSFLELIHENQGVRRDFILSIICLGFSLVLLLWLIPNYVLDYGMGGKVSPRFFPYIIAGSILILSIAFLIQTIKNEKGAQADARKFDTPTIICIVSFFAYQQLITIIGFIPASFLYTICLMLLYGVRSKMTIGIFSVILILILSFFFENVAQVPLPKGLLLEWLLG